MALDPLPRRKVKEPFNFIPCGEIIEIPSQKLRIYHVDQGQIEAFLEYYGLSRNGCKDAPRPLSWKAVEKTDLQEPKSKGRR